MSDQAIDQLTSVAASPLKASGDSGSMEREKIVDQIAFDRYRRSVNAASTSGGFGGIQVKKIVPGDAL